MRIQVMPMECGLSPTMDALEVSLVAKDTLTYLLHGAESSLRS